MLLAAQGGTGSVNGGHAQVQAVLVLSDVLGAAEGGSGVLVDGGQPIGSGWLSLASSLLHYHHNTFAVGYQVLRWISPV